MSAAFGILLGVMLVGGLVVWTLWPDPPPAPLGAFAAVAP